MEIWNQKAAGNNIGKSKRIHKSRGFSDMLKYQADFLLWVSGIFVCWALIFFFFQSLSSPVSQKYTNSQDYYFFFLPALFCCHQNASALLFPSCFAHSYLTASYTTLPQGQHRVHQEHSKIGAMISISMLALQPGAAIAEKWIQL